MNVPQKYWTVLYIVTLFNDKVFFIFIFWQYYIFEA